MILPLSPDRARVLRWCDRNVTADTVAIWSPEDKQTLAGLVADGLALPIGTRYEITPRGDQALRLDAADRSAPAPFIKKWPVLPIETASYGLDALDHLTPEDHNPLPDFPPGDPDL